MEDQVADTHSQINLKPHSRINTTLDSGCQPTVSGGATKASKHDTTNMSASDYNFAPPQGMASHTKKNYTLSTIPKAMVHMSSADDASS